MVSDKKQHRRVEWSAQRALQEPVTAAQTVRQTHCDSTHTRSLASMSTARPC
jgi:hypothetical protein